MEEHAPPLATPVLLLIFNRPSLTLQSFERIRGAKPQRLFIAGDGPRRDHPSDVKLVEQARAVTQSVDWDCDVRTLFRDANLGCGRAVSSAVDWAFESVDDLIILEDDCLAEPSFFRYCAELIERFRDDKRVFVISGDNFQQNPPREPYSYYFSRFNHCWGWATWKRAWRHFDFEMEMWPQVRDGAWLTDILHDDLAEKYWTRMFDAVHAGQIDTWDYQWAFACWAQSGLTVLPTANLVRNIGFDETATHTDDATDTKHSILDRELDFPLSHPPYVLRDETADSWTQLHHYGYGHVGFRNRLLYRLRALLRLRHNY